NRAAQYRLVELGVAEIGALEDRSGQVGAAHIRARKIGAAQHAVGELGHGERSVREPGAGEIRALRLYRLQIRRARLVARARAGIDVVIGERPVAQIGLGKASALEPCAPEACAAQIGLAQIGAAEARQAKIGDEEVGLLEPRAVEPAALQIGAGEIGAREVLIAEIEAAQVMMRERGGPSAPPAFDIALLQQQHAAQLLLSKPCLRGRRARHCSCGHARSVSQGAVKISSVYIESKQIESAPKPQRKRVRTAHFASTRSCRWPSMEREYG